MAENPYGQQKIIYHPEKLESFRDGKVTSPIYVRVKPTNACNHRCFYCSYAEESGHILSERVDRDDYIPKDKMMELLNDFGEMGVKAITYSGGGEPLIYPYIEETIERASENGLCQSVITNGQRLDGRTAELLGSSDWVRISADSPDGKIFAKTRRVPESWFGQLCNNIRKFSEIKEEGCELGVNYIATHLNYDRLYEAAELFKGLGVNHIRFFPRWLDEGFEEYHSDLREESQRQIERAKELEDEEDGRFKVLDKYEDTFNLDGINERGYERCFILETVPVVAADCRVYDCHDRAYTSDGEIGSVEKQSFRELWFSEETRDRFRNFDPRERCRHHCSFDSRNLFIKDMVEGNVDIINLLKIFSRETDKPYHANYI